MRSTIAFFAPLLSVLAVSPLRADPVNWSATSDTAMAISGDIVVDDYTLTFANGKSLAIEPYEAGRVGDGEDPLQLHLADVGFGDLGGGGREPDRCRGDGGHGHGVER